METNTVFYKRKWNANLYNDIRVNWILWLMILPSFAYFVIIKYIPMVGLLFAFKQFNLSLGIFKSPWVGLDNFRFLAKSGILYEITRNTVLYNLVFIFFGNFLQIIIAIILSELTIRWFKKITQSLMFLPYFVSFVILSVLVYNIFNYEFGALNSFLKSIGVEPIDVYSSPGVWKYILVIFSMWKWLGYGTVVYSAAIMGIDDVLYEAAEIDGANIFQKIWKITVPLLKPTVVILVLLALGQIMRGQFELFYQIVGDNGQLYQQTDIIDTFVFRSLIKTFDVSMGAAAQLYQSMFGLVIVVIANYVVKRVHEEYALF